MQYRKNPAFQPTSPVPSFQNRVEPSNWLTETDFASTLQQADDQENLLSLMTLQPSACQMVMHALRQRHLVLAGC